ncbi:MAG: methyl-accepting chemotaxis protein [Geobacteraceae bacterium]|nr:methyl-accepting chemotaxis protein [Geobacteraceae bacterium]
MSKSRYASMFSIRARMVVISLVAALVTGGVFTSINGVYPLIASLLAAFVSALLCAGICGRLIAELRKDQSRMISSFAGDAPEAAPQPECDDLSALLSGTETSLKLFESRNRDHQEMLQQIFALQEKLGLIMDNWSSGDEMEVAQVKDAVNAMENLNSAFSLVIAEIEELSGRTEERASISAQMSATTDAIAENINQYSNFVLETSSSIEQMAAAIRETADNIRALSESTEQTVCSINTISASQTTVRDNSERSAAASENVRTQAQHGLRSMAATLKAMQEIAKSNDESFESINRLSRHSARVGEFLSVIQEVVEQTNLLSLNASIIAAQAGTRGRAFAVVAEEVRSLAHRTSASTREIEELVRNIQKETSMVQRTVTQGKDKVKEGVKISGLANDALIMIEKSAEEAFGMVANIAAATTEQTVNIERITEEAEKNLERVQHVTLATEHQQQGANLIVKNLEHMRELAHRINSSAQEQAKGNRLYLKSVMEDNDRTSDLKNEAARNILLASQAVEAVRGVESLIAANTREGEKIVDALSELVMLIDRYSDESILELDQEADKNE